MKARTLGLFAAGVCVVVMAIVLAVSVYYSSWEARTHGKSLFLARVSTCLSLISECMATDTAATDSRLRDCIERSVAACGGWGVVANPLDGKPALFNPDPDAWSPKSTTIQVWCVTSAPCEQDNYQEPVYFAIDSLFQPKVVTAAQLPSWFAEAKRAQAN